MTAEDHAPTPALDTTQSRAGWAILEAFVPAHGDDRGVLTVLERAEARLLTPQEAPFPPHADDRMGVAQIAPMA